GGRRATVDRRREVGRRVARVGRVREGGHRPAERRLLRRGDAEDGAAERVVLGHGGGAGGGEAGRAGGVVRDRGGDGEGALVGVGVAAADGERAARRAADGAGGGGAVAPVDRRRPVAGHLGGVALVGEAGHRAAEGLPLRRRDRLGEERPEVALGD